MKKTECAWLVFGAILSACGQPLSFVSVPVKECRLERSLAIGEARRESISLSNAVVELPPRAQALQREIPRAGLELRLRTGETLGRITVYQTSEHRVRVEDGKIVAIELSLPVRGTELTETACVRSADLR